MNLVQFGQRLLQGRTGLLQVRQGLGLGSCVLIIVGVEL